MRILYLDQSGQLGGGEIALLPWLCLERERSLVLLFEDGPFRHRLEEENVTVQVVASAALKHIRRESGWRTAFSSLSALLQLRKSIRKVSGPYDLIYANSMKAMIVAALVRRRGQPVIWHLRDILSKDHFSKALRMTAVTIANTCVSAVIANSQATAAALVREGGRKNISVVYDGVSAAPFQRLDAESLRKLRTSIAPETHLLIGVFSRLSPWKGQHILLEAVRGIPDASLLVVGDALFGEEKYAATLKSRASEDDLAGRVSFLGFRSDIADLMQCVDVVVHCSTSPEPFGLVIVEGMLAGRPVIATAAGGAAEILEDGSSGILVTPGSVSELRDALEGLRRSPLLRQTMGDAGRNNAITRFPLEAMFAGIDEVVRRFDKELAERTGGLDDLELADAESAGASDPLALK